MDLFGKSAKNGCTMPGECDIYFQQGTRQISTTGALSIGVRHGSHCLIATTLPAGKEYMVLSGIRSDSGTDIQRGRF